MEDAQHGVSDEQCPGVLVHALAAAVGEYEGGGAMVAHDLDVGVSEVVRLGERGEAELVARHLPQARGPCRLSCPEPAPELAPTEALSGVRTTMPARAESPASHSMMKSGTRTN